jgi:AcrR family transcriptional regulator
LDVTASKPADSAFEDMTARARIREAAIRLFTERGVDRTPILEIARAARVSGGLVRHHFGSKDELREACDTYATNELLRRYLGRVMIDGSPAAAARFEETIDATERWFADQPGLDLPDPRACAAVLASMTLGVFAMQDHIAVALGEDPLSTEVQQRIALAYSVLYSPSLLTPDLSAQIQRSRGHQPPARATTEKEDDD